MSEFVMVRRELLENCANYMEGSASGMVQFWHDELRAVLAQEAGHVEEPLGMVEPFMYGIEQPDGKPHYSELCVSGEASDLESEVESMNDGEDLGYRVVALYTSPPAPVSVVLPERCELPDGETTAVERAYSRGCNDTIDKVKELNQ